MQTPPQLPEGAPIPVPVAEQEQVFIQIVPDKKVATNQKRAYNRRQKTERREQKKGVRAG